MNLPLVFLSQFAKTLTYISKKTGRGAGTSISGVLVEKYFPDVLKNFAGKYKIVIFISGTNGKTTTRGLINNILKIDGHKVCSNLGGANILRGIVSSLLKDLDNRGNVRSDILVLEVEEASMPKLAKYIQPDYLVLTNVFRDQLDLYGEVDKTVDYFIDTIKLSQAKLKKVILNGDDSKLLGILDEIDLARNKVVKFGLSPELQGSDFEGLNNNLPKLQWLIKSSGKHYEVYLKKQKFLSVVPLLGGNYNLYNILSAIVLSKELGIIKKNIVKGINEYVGAFGRGEKIQLKNQKIEIYLVKNPAGFHSVLDTIKNYKNYGLCMLINDKIADGRDVSWLWDVDFENKLNLQNLQEVICGGSRGLDILLRLEQGGVGDLDLKNCVDTIHNVLKSIQKSKIKKWIILSTYTAMREVRGEIGKQIKLPEIDELG